jgi:hypothetical protein
MFKHTGAFDKWKAGLAMMLTKLAIDKSGSKRTEMETPVIIAAIGLLVSAQGFSQVFQALRSVVTFAPELGEKIDKLEQINKLRRYAVGGSCGHIQDAYAACVDDADETARVTQQVEQACDAIRAWVQHRREPFHGQLDSWQMHIFHIATMRDRANS